jgi:hypothetical protein
MRKPPPIKSCFCCPTFITNSPNSKYCACCKAIVRRQIEITANERKKAIQRSARLEKQEHEARPKKVLVTGAEQRKINTAIDNKYSVNLSSVRYLPGSPEFERIAAQTTHISRICP